MKQLNGFKFTKVKSLNEQINDVKKSKLSKEDKIITLKACGLRDKEIENILRTSVPKGTSPQRLKFTFGVEIECYHANSYDLVNAGSVNNIEIRPEGYNHTDNAKYFKLVPDGSISGANDPNEVVSPILEGNKGLKAIENACKALESVGAQVNKSCGLHVHIGAAMLTGEQYVNVFKNYQRLEKIIDTFMSESRRANNGYYCRTMQGFDFTNCHNNVDMKDIMYNCRYYKVNAMSYTRHKTIEFRQHQGTTNYTKISNWVKFCAKLVSWSRFNVLDKDVESVDAIPFLSKAEKAFFKKRAIELSRQG